MGPNFPGHALGFEKAGVSPNKHFTAFLPNHHLFLNPLSHTLGPKHSSIYKISQFPFFLETYPGRQSHLFLTLKHLTTLCVSVVVSSILCWRIDVHVVFLGLSRGQGSVVLGDRIMTLTCSCLQHGSIFQVIGQVVLVPYILGFWASKRKILWRCIFFCIMYTAGWCLSFSAVLQTFLPMPLQPTQFTRLLFGEKKAPRPHLCAFSNKPYCTQAPCFVLAVL